MRGPQYLLICLSKEIGPVGEAASHQSCVNVIEWLLIDPQIFRIVNDKLEIRRNAIQNNRSVEVPSK